MRFLSSIIIIALVAFTLPSGSWANVLPAPMFCEHAVLQQGTPVPVWGTADPGEAVSVAYAGQKLSTVADPQGKWTVRLTPLRVGQTGALTITGKNTLAFDDVVAGEVWLCSGQSNMAFTLGEAKDASREIAGANFPQIRQFLVPHKPAGRPQDSMTIKGVWRPCSPQTAKEFTAVGYFFARDLTTDLGNVPIGLINSTWGGTPIQAWIDRPALESDAALLATVLERKKQEVAAYPATEAKYEEALKQWEGASAQAKAEGKTFPAAKPGTPGSPETPHYARHALYNGMIHPLLPYAIRGTLWYQGEANAMLGATGGSEYARMLALLVRSWRKVWSEGDFPFAIVQLPNWDVPPRYDNTGTSWALLREAQAKVGTTEPNTMLAVTIDVGDPGTIHPKNKQVVGHRLAMLAESKVYGKPTDGSAPTFRTTASEPGGKLRIKLDHADGLARKGDGPLSNFAVAGSDGRFASAEARLDGQDVIVSSPQVAFPTAVRYAWTNNPTGCNLYNKSDLPLAPFRTDTAAQ